MPIEFAGGYAAIAVLAFLSLALVQFAALPKPLSRQERSRGRPLGELIRQPALVVAVLCAMVAYGAMNLIMVRSEGHTSELQSLMRISYAVFCLKKKNNTNTNSHNIITVHEPKLARSLPTKCQCERLTTS